MEQNIHKKVLIIEPNPYHQEILPGFIKYFIDLSYDVTLFTRIEPNQSKVFSRFNYDFKTTVYDYNKIDEELSKINLKEFDFVFFSSIERGENGGLHKTLDDIKIPLDTKFGVLGCYHTTDHVEEQNTWDLYNQGRIFFLNDFEFNGKKGKMLAPIYFGSVDKKHNKNKKTRFILVGHFWKYMHNHRWIFNIIDKLKQRKLKDFEIIMIGEGEYTYHKEKRWYRHLTPLRYNKYLKVLGKLEFDKMFEEVNNSDFLCPMLDEAYDGHSHYLTKCTSGARNLSLGLNIPTVINEKFAKVYHLETGSVLYTENNIVEAMEKAIKMNNDDYQKMKTELQKTADEIYNKSLKNLKDTIETVN